MTGVADLPEEILSSILEWVTENAYPADILPLLSVDKRFYRLSWPLLYREIDVSYDEGVGTDVFRLSRLMQTLFTSPMRAAEVHELTIEDYCGWEFDTANLSELLESVEPAQTIINHAFHGEDDWSAEQRVAWLEQWRAGNGYCMLALLLVSLPNLRHLDFQGWTEDIWRLIAMLYDGLEEHARGQGKAPPFQLLDSVTTGSFAPESPDSTFPLAIIARLPHVRCLRAISTGDGDENHDPDTVEEFFDLEPKSSGLTDIDLSPNCKLLHAHMLALLRAPQNLTKFYYHIGHTKSYIEFRSTELMEALRQQAHSLEEVTLHVTMMLQSYNHGDRTCDPVSFSGFDRLRKLGLDSSLVFGDECYLSECGVSTVQSARARAMTLAPPTIKMISVVVHENEVDVDGIDAAFDVILENKASAFPQLVKLKLGVTEKFEKHCLRKLKNTQAKAIRQGVDLVLQRIQKDYREEIKFQGRLRERNSPEHDSPSEQ